VTEEFYLNRRGGIRVDYHSAIRFQPDPRRKFHLAHAVTQNLSLRGMQILTPTVPDPKRRFEVWIPLEGSTVVPAIAHTEWMEVEDNLADSPYWIRSGVSLTFRNESDRRLYVDTVLKRANVDRIRREQEASKIGFVF
jgi:hypothetical protein